MFDFAQDNLVTPSFVKNGDIVIVISGTDTLPQAMFYFLDCSRGRLLLVSKVARFLAAQISFKVTLIITCTRAMERLSPVGKRA